MLRLRAKHNVIANLKGTLKNETFFDPIASPCKTKTQKHPVDASFGRDFFSSMKVSNDDKTMSMNPHFQDEVDTILNLIDYVTVFVCLFVSKWMHEIKLSWK